jgi:hypothetical protein
MKRLFDRYGQWTKAADAMERHLDEAMHPLVTELCAKFPPHEVSVLLWELLSWWCCVESMRQEQAAKVAAERTEKA